MIGPSHVHNVECFAEPIDLSFQRINILGKFGGHARLILSMALRVANPFWTAAAVLALYCCV
jgi:hypothetical protein